MSDPRGGRDEPLRIRARLLVPLVLLLVCPAVAGFALGGPPVGLAVGALEVTALLVFAARSRFDVPIEFRAPGRGRYALLVLALGAVEQPAQAARIAEISGAGAVVESPEAERPPQVLVLAPATNTGLAHWLSDVDAARFDAQRRLALSLGTLAAAGVDATGRVGDPDPLQAVEDELRSYAVSEVVVVPGQAAPDVAELNRRLPLPVRVL